MSLRQNSRRKRAVAALSLGCAAPSAAALTASTAAPRARAGQPRMAVAEKRGVDQLRGHAPAALREQTLQLFWTETEFSVEDGWEGTVKTAARGELTAPRTIGRGRNPSCLAVDSMSRNVYWTDHGHSAITRASLDGTTAEPVAQGVFGHRFKDGPWGLAVDPTSSTVIWSSAGHGKIRRCDLHGDNVQTLSQGDTNAWSAAGPWGLAPHLRPGCAAARPPPGMRHTETLAPERGMGSVFWASWGRISCCELGSGHVRDVVRGVVDPIGLVIDANNERLFWTDAKAGKVQCANFDGSRVCDVATGLAEPWGLALGPTHLFWTERRRGSIMSCSLKTGAVSEVVGGLSSPEGIGLLNGPAPVAPPHAAAAAGKYAAAGGRHAAASSVGMHARRASAAARAAAAAAKQVRTAELGNPPAVPPARRARRKTAGSRGVQIGALVGAGAAAGAAAGAHAAAGGGKPSAARQAAARKPSVKVLTSGDVAAAVQARDFFASVPAAAVTRRAAPSTQDIIRLSETALNELKA